MLGDDDENLQAKNVTGNDSVYTTAISVADGPQMSIENYAQAVPCYLSQHDR